MLREIAPGQEIFEVTNDFLTIEFHLSRLAASKLQCSRSYAHTGMIYGLSAGSVALVENSDD